MYSLTKMNLFLWLTGEKALQSEDVRTASIIADSDEVGCLVIDRESFNQLMCNIDAIRSHPYQDEVDKVSTGVRQKIDNEFKNLRLSELRVIATLGVGGFGRVCNRQFCYSNIF